MKIRDPGKKLVSHKSEVLELEPAESADNAQAAAPELDGIPVVIVSKRLDWFDHVHPARTMTEQLNFSRRIVREGNGRRGRWLRALLAGHAADPFGRSRQRDHWRLPSGEIASRDHPEGLRELAP